MERINCSTEDLAVENAKKLIGLFPECEGEKGTVDLDKLRQVLSSTAVEGNVERYEFTWPGKRKAMAAASAATTKTLRPCVEESVGRDGTSGGFDSENLYIEGDNLEALKLLQRNYAGKVKMIYIDPPYNTGHDFVYRDRFSLTEKELAQEGGAFDEDGNRFEKNDSAEARYHSNWCSMMYPRLKLARNLLRDDGVLFMSIDDNEVVNARKLCDEVFGEANFVAQIVWKRKRGRDNSARWFSKAHEYSLVFAKSIDRFDVHYLELDDETKKAYKNSDNDPRGPHRDLACWARGTQGGVKYVFTSKLGIEFSERLWLFSKANMEKMDDENRLIFHGDNIYRKLFLNENPGKIPETLWDDTSNAANASDEIKSLFQEIVFDTPKPVPYVQRMVRIATDNNSIILDFFSGSASTAHAVMKLNAEDGGKRKFIMVQLPEACDEDSEAAKAGYKNICEIGKERIRRAGKKIMEEVAAKNAESAKDGPDLFGQDLQNLSRRDVSNPENSVNPVKKENPDVGFRVLKLDTSSLNDTSATVGETTQEFADFDRIKSDRSPEDILFQILLETRIALSEPIVKEKVGGNEVFFVGVERRDEDAASCQNAPMAACLDRKAKLDNDFFLELAKLKPEIVFFRDDAFDDDSARINVEQIFKQNSPSTSVKVI